jgi:arylsulfatase
MNLARLPAIALLALLSVATVASAEPARPNVILIFADNLGYGEIACNGTSRMVPTPRIDGLAAGGLRLTNFNVETWCAPSRSALLTGRYGIRSGTSEMTHGLQGMTQWEVTLAELLSARGYATAIYGKWHLGDTKGRYPTDQGFDEWYGIAHSWDDGMITSRPGFIPVADSMAFVLESTKGKRPQELEIFDLDVGAQFDQQLTDRAIAYIRRNAAAKKPFFLYMPIAAVHLPVYCDSAFVGKSGAGLIGDAVMAMDFNVGRILDGVTEAGIAENTIVIFTSDNGPEAQDPYRGTAGVWSGNYNTAMEGSLRVPFMMQWPGHIAAGRVSNEIVHITDLFTTLASVAGAKIPTDRLIDGVDQTDFLTGKQEKSNRDSFPVYVFGQLYAVKWQDWKMHYVWRPTPADGPLTVRKLFNLRSDPKEEFDVFWQNLQMQASLEKIVADFQATLEKEPPIPPGTPDPYRPAKKK